jgi:hypothetical protein
MDDSLKFGNNAGIIVCGIDSRPVSLRGSVIVLVSKIAPERSTSMTIAGAGLTKLPLEAIREHAPHVTSLDLTDNLLA